MRRIFGGSNLTNSSTSTSLASDALPSPTSAAHSHSQLGSDHGHGHGHVGGQQPDPPLTPTGTGTGEGPPGTAGKGWFGGLGAGLSRTASNTSTTPAVNGHAGGAREGRHERSGSATSASFPGMSALLHHNTSKPSPSASSRRGSEFEDEEFSPERLPFGQAARALSPALGVGASPRSVGGAGGHTRASSRSSFGNLAGGGVSRPFSPEGVLAHADGPAGTGKGVQKDALLVELLSGAAALEAREFEVLDWEEMQEVKKEHALLSTRLTSLTRSLALETRLRDSAAKLVRLSAPSSSSPSPSPLPSASSSSRPSRPSVTREQATAQLATAQAKLESVQAEHHKLSAREAELRTKLLRHTAGVLALALRKKEEDDAAAALSVGLGSPLSASFPPSAAASSAGPNGVDQTPRAFDAPHFFAGNRDALDPLLHSSSRSNASPRGSPALSSSTHQHDAQALLNAQHDLAAAQQRVEELETDLARAREEQQRRDGEVEDARRAQREAEERVAEQERNAERSRREAGQREEEERGRREDEAAREREAREAVEREKRELEDRLRGVEDELESARSAAAARPPSPPQPEPAAPAADISSPRLAALESERSTLVQSNADVLRRHRTRAVLGPVFREAGPGLDDSPGSPLLARSPVPVSEDEGEAGLDLPNEVARTLDSHFAAASRHVEALQAQVEEHERNAAASTSSALAVEEELHGAHERMEHLEADLASVTNERDAAVLEGEQLRGELESLQGKVTSLGREAEKEEGMLEGARREVEDVRRRLAEVEAAAEERGRELAKLEELHASLVGPAAGRSTPSPVLPPRKSSKAGTMGGFLADVASKAKDAVTSSSSMSSITSASSVASSSPSTSPATTFSALPSTTASAATGAFSVDSLVERVKALLDEHRATSARVADVEAQVREKEQSGGQEKEGLERKVKDLEERIDYSSQAEVQMLERLNDLTESLESTRASKRQLEQRIATLEADLAAAQSAPASSATAAPAAGGGADDTELQELRDQIADLEEELADAQKREQKTRASLLDELSTAQSEVSSLKTQLRQAQRKAGGGGAAR